MDIEILLNKYLVKSITPEEKHQFSELLTSSDNERSFKEILFSHLSNFNEGHHEKRTIDFELIYNQILYEILHREISESENQLLKRRVRVRKLFIHGLTLAAIFCFAFFLGRIFNQIDGKKSPKLAVIETYNEIKTPLGGRSEIKLADGTNVIMNGGSTLKYSSEFNSKNRDLILDGEAYFKVAKNINLPLIVNAGNIKIKATGTEFNVKAYQEEGLIETTLIEGKVEIIQKNNNSEENKLLELTPNQKAIYVKELDHITLGKIKENETLAVKPAKLGSDKLLVSSKVNVDQITAWTKNKLIFRGENLESLCIQLQRKYNVTFVFGNEEIKKYRFSGILLDETLEQVLNVIKLTAPIDYLLDGKNVLMVSNKEQVEKYSNHVKKYKI